MHLEPNFPVQIEMEASNKVCTEKGDTGECEFQNEKKREIDSIEPESSSTSFVIDFSDANKTENNSLQEAFLKYREKKKNYAWRKLKHWKEPLCNNEHLSPFHKNPKLVLPIAQNELIHATKKKKKKAKHHDPSCPKRMAKLRSKFLKQAMKYIGTPYARKHWSKDSPEYSSPYFLDCCGLVRRVLWDLKKDFGFKIGRWNQAYMYDTLPITVEREEDMKPGDLVFMSGIYNNPKSKKQIHNMTHVEIWYGEGTKVLGSRWNNGKVSIFDHYQFEAKSFHSSVYHFKSIDTWLKGICKSFCPEHPWRRSRFRSKPRKKSVFNIDKQLNEERGQASLSAEGETDMQSVASFSDLSSAKSTQSDGDKMEAAQIQEAEQAEGQPQENDSRATVASSPSKNSIFLTEIVSSSDAKPTICDFYREDTESLEDSDVSQDSPRPKSKNLNEIDSIKQKVDVSTDSVDSLHIGDLDLHSCDKCSENPLPKETTGDLTADFTRINNILGDMGAMSCDPSHIKSGFDSFDDDTDPDVSFSDEDYNVRFGTSTVSDANGKQATNRSQEPSSGDISDGQKQEKILTKVSSSNESKVRQKSEPPPASAKKINLEAKSQTNVKEVKKMELQPKNGVAEQKNSPKKNGSGDGRKDNKLVHLIKVYYAIPQKNPKVQTQTKVQSTEITTKKSSDIKEDTEKKESLHDILWQNINNSPYAIQTSKITCSTKQNANSNLSNSRKKFENQKPINNSAQDCKKPCSIKPVNKKSPESPRKLDSVKSLNNSAESSKQPDSVKPVYKCAESSQKQDNIKNVNITIENSGRPDNGKPVNSSAESYKKPDNGKPVNSSAESSKKADNGKPVNSSAESSKKPDNGKPVNSSVESSRKSDNGNSVNSSAESSKRPDNGKPVNNSVESSRKPDNVKPVNSSVESSRKPDNVKPVNSSAESSRKPDNVKPVNSSAEISKKSNNVKPVNKTRQSLKSNEGGSAENSESETPSDGNKREKNNGSGKRSPGDKGEGGGGKKQPFKSPKPPNCSLPSNTVPTYFIGGGNGVTLVDNSLQKLGWKRISDKYDEKFKLKWTECKININWSSFREGEQLVNHIPNCNLLTNKFGLLKTLQEYERVTLNTKGRTPRLKFTEFHPETYVLDESSDREAFLDTYKDGELWISKPTGMNQGKGIYIIRSRDEVMKTLEERDEKAKTRKRHKPLMSRIMQRYITNPLLLDGRKFDIRAYMLIASTVPYLVLHHKGYLRLTCQKYDGEDTDLSKHLTNQGIQKKDENYAEMKEETVWSMEKFNDYINEQVAADKGLEENWVHNSLTRQMRKIMLHCFNSVKKKLQTKCGYFGLYGFDFMIDQNMKVWLIEVNVNPAIHTQCGTLQEVIPQMVEETLYLSIECFEKTKRNHVLLPLKSQKNFYILHCGKLWGATAPRQTRSVSPVKESSDQTKVPQARRSVSPARSVPKPVVKQVQVSLPLPTKPAQTSATSTSISVPPKKSDISLPPLKTNSNEEIKLKMTHNSAGTSSVRGKSERGN